MGNGIIETFKLNGIAVRLGKIEQLKKHYGVAKSDEVRLGNILIEKKRTSYIILINGNKWAKFNMGIMSQTVGTLASAFSYGIIKSSFQFLTTDKHVMSKEYIKKICEQIDSEMSNLEMEYKKQSSLKWN